MPKEDWSETIQTLLFAYEMTAERLAKEIGKTPRTISRWISKETNPPRSARLKVAQKFHYPSIEEFEQALVRKQRARQLQAASEVAESDLDSLSGIEREIFFFRFVRDPGDERMALMGDFPALGTLRSELATSLGEILESGERLFHSVVRIERHLS